MNLLGIPLADYPWGFAVVAGCTTLVALTLLFVLKKLRWF